MVNPFLRQPSASQRTPLRAERPDPRTAADGVVALRLYDPLDSWGGAWGLSAKEFTAALDELGDGVSEIRLLINSPGGAVWEGLAVLNALRAHPARVVAVVEGIAASAASFIATGVDELHMMQNAELFVHNAWGMCVGNVADMTKMAADLAHEDRNIASIYAAKAGGDVDDWLAVMGADTWYSADEAVAAGLADRVIEPVGDGAAAARNRFDLSIFAHAARPSARTDRPQTPAASAVGDPSPERSPAVAFSPEQLTTMRQSLGLSAEADEATIVAALAEALAEQADTPPAAALPDGVVTVDAATLENLRADAARGAEAARRQEREDRETLVAAAVADGRIAPARTAAWLASLEADPGAADTLAKLERGLIPVAERGYGADTSDAVAPANTLDEVRNSDLYRLAFGS